jgi:hypothetical protein
MNQKIFEKERSSFTLQFRFRQVTICMPIINLLLLFLLLNKIICEVDNIIVVVVNIVIIIIIIITTTTVPALMFDNYFGYD